MANKRRSIDPKTNDIKNTIVTTPARQKLLEALNSGKTFSSITQLCEYAGISRFTYYDTLKDDKFKKKLIDKAKSSLYSDLPSILRSLVKMAKKGSFPHQKLYLESVGAYVEQGKETNVNIGLQVISSVPDEVTVKAMDGKEVKQIKGKRAQE